MGALTIGVDDLEDKDLLVLRSSLRLRSEQWSWVDRLADADIWIVDTMRSMQRTPVDALGAAGVICLVGQLPAAGDARLLEKPLKAMRLMRAIDAVLATLQPRARTAPPMVASEPIALTVPTAAPSAVVTLPVAQNPWRDRQLRFTRLPNMARFPVTAELIGWLHMMCERAVRYETIVKAVPMDVELLDDILDEAACDGTLVDQNGASLQALARPRKGLRWSLLKR